MGFSLPAAIGCKVGAPDKIVVDIDGDASLSMTAMELATAAQHNIGVKCLVLNNGVQGMVYQWQGEPRVHDSASRLRLSAFSTTCDTHTRRCRTPILGCLPSRCMCMLYALRTQQSCHKK